MSYGTGFGNRNHVTTPYGPGQRNSGWRALVCGGNMGKRGITQQAAAGAAEWRIDHHWHAAFFTPWQQISFNAATIEVITDLIGGTDRRWAHEKDLPCR